MRVFLTSLLVFIFAPAFCQDGGISGRVIGVGSKSNFDELEIYLRQADKPESCMLVDQCGEFEMRKIKPGTYNIQLLNCGNVVFDDVIIINAGKVERLNLAHPGLQGESRKVCPHGHIDNLIRIAYGLPTSELIRQSEEGKVRLGGCMMTNLKWYCKKHRIEF